MATNILRGVHDVVGYIDSRTGIRGRAGIIWWLALGGLFLDAFSNSALSAGLGPMTRDLELSATQIALLTSMASWVALVFNPIGGWMADRYGAGFAAGLGTCRVWVNGESAAAETGVGPLDEVAVLPPVSGGAA